jgi:hypothetical protein
LTGSIPVSLLNLNDCSPLNARGTADYLGVPPALPRVPEPVSAANSRENRHPGEPLITKTEWKIRAVAELSYRHTQDLESAERIGM